MSCYYVYYIIFYLCSFCRNGFFNQTKLTKGKHIYLQSNANGMKQSKIFWNASNEANKIVHYLLGFIDFTWCFFCCCAIDHEFILHHWKSTTTSTKCLFLLIIKNIIFLFYFFQQSLVRVFLLCISIYDLLNH